MHLLIPYVHLRDHEDPLFSELTHGDGGSRARKLKSDLSKGEYVFFHTRRAGKKYITAFYVVDRVLDMTVVCQDAAIGSKYNSPHIEELLKRRQPLHAECDAIVFGDPIISRVLERPFGLTSVSRKGSRSGSRSRRIKPRHNASARRRAPGGN